jgi:hypothetical protein
MEIADAHNIIIDPSITWNKICIICKNQSDIENYRSYLSNRIGASIMDDISVSNFCDCSPDILMDIRQTGYKQIVDSLLLYSNNDYENTYTFTWVYILVRSSNNIMVRNSERDDIDGSEYPDLEEVEEYIVEEDIEDIDGSEYPDLEEVD